MKAKSDNKKFIVILAVIVLLIIAVCVILFKSGIFGGKSQDGELSTSGYVTDMTESRSEAVPSVNTTVSTTAAQTVVQSAGTPGEYAQAYDSSIIGQEINYVYVYGNTAYEYYNYVGSTARRYAQAVNAAADSVAADGISVYNMIVPTSVDITLNDTVRSTLPCSNQRTAISDIASMMNSNVKTVNIFDTLKAHSNEYLYFRTDHHWTSKGAYYAYSDYMSAKGGAAPALTDFTLKEYPGFLGSFYRDTDENAVIAATPDTVEAYYPPCNTSFKYKAKGASDFTNYPLICDASSFSSANKYLCFAAGDQPIAVIENTDTANTESCVFVKESFGDVFAPYLACNYKYVYEIDYRYFDGDITDFAKQNGVKDILIQSNISMTRNADLVSDLAEKL